jgi:hypothetical protein
MQAACRYWLAAGSGWQDWTVPFREATAQAAGRMLCSTHVAHLQKLQPKSLITMGMVGDPGIEPGVGRPGGVTVP